MRLLFDENLSETVLVRLTDLYPGSMHVRRELGDSANDDRVWEFARANDLVLVTRDQDFARLSATRGSPPKVVWIRVQKPTNAAVESIIRSHESTLRAFAADSETQFLTIAGPERGPVKWPAHWKSTRNSG